MIEKVYSFLDKIGMNKKQQDVYLTVLQWGEMSISQIATHTKKPRSSTYDIVDAMTKAGRLITNTHSNHSSYSVVKPEYLISLLQKKIDRLQDDIVHMQDDLMLFDQYKAGRESQVTLRLYEGGEALEPLFFDQTFDCGYFYRNIDRVMEFTGWSMDEVVSQFSSNHCREQYSLIVPSEGGTLYYETIQRSAVENNHIRFLPIGHKLGGLHTSLIDGTIHHLLLTNPAKAVVMKNEMIYQNQLTIFMQLRSQCSNSLA